MKQLKILTIIFFINNLGIAQTKQVNNVPHLNEHYFIPNMNIPSPFIKSHFGMNLGIASSSEFENVILDRPQFITYKHCLPFMIG